MLQFRSFSSLPGLRHAITSREGGVSESAFASFNLAFHVGDNENHVVQNRQILADQLGFDSARLVAAQQVHGANVQIVAARDAGRGAHNFASAISATDALITAEKNLPLLILVADCAPILLVEPESQILAVVHAGWRGALAGIAGNAAREMAKLGANIEKIQAGIGPCLCPHCLEIGPEVAEQVKPVDSAAILRGWEKPHLDLRGLIRRDLEKNDVLVSQIETMHHCPKCEGKQFFSHRGQDGVAGRFGLVAFWK